MNRPPGGAAASPGCEADAAAPAQRSGPRVPPQVAVVRRLLDAVERRDLAAILDCYDPQVEIVEVASLPYGGTYSGLDGARRHAVEFARSGAVTRGRRRSAWTPPCSPERVARSQR